MQTLQVNGCTCNTSKENARAKGFSKILLRHGFFFCTQNNVHAIFYCRDCATSTFCYKTAYVTLVSLANWLIYTYNGMYVLRRFQHCTGHIMTGSWKGRGNQYLQFVRILYCKLLTNSKQIPAFPLEAMPGTEPWPQRWEARVLPLCHRGPYMLGCKQT